MLAGPPLTAVLKPGANHIMRISSILRTATLALSLTAAMGGMSAAFAADTNATAAQQQQASNASPYDGQDFVLQSNNINN
jgi:hypothetical protein